MPAFLTIALAFLAPVVLAASDVRGYEKRFNCGFVEITAKGGECVSDMNCPSLSHVTHEDISYRLDGAFRSLPGLSRQLPNGPKILKESDRVFRISQLKCQAKRKVAVLYWGGGNCKEGCEWMVAYSAAGGRLVPLGIMNGSWDRVPFVKKYAQVLQATSSK